MYFGFCLSSVWLVSFSLFLSMLVPWCSSSRFPDFVPLSLFFHFSFYFFFSFLFTVLFILSVFSVLFWQKYSLLFFLLLVVGNFVRRLVGSSSVVIMYCCHRSFHRFVSLLLLEGFLPSDQHESRSTDSRIVLQFLIQELFLLYFVDGRF